jgi:hypothetical protein
MIGTVVNAVAAILIGVLAVFIVLQIARTVV